MKKLEYGLIVDWFHRHAPVTIQASTRIVGIDTRYYRQPKKKSSLMLLIRHPLLNPPKTPIQNLSHQSISSRKQPVNV